MWYSKSFLHVWITHGGKIPEKYELWFDTEGGEHITMKIDFERVHHFPPPPGLVEKVNIPPILNRTHFFHEELAREKIFKKSEHFVCFSDIYYVGRKRKAGII